MRRFVLILMLIASTGCGDDSGSSNGGTGGQDAGSPDAGVTPDVAMVEDTAPAEPDAVADVSTPDASSGDDARAGDVDGRDATPMPDAAPDAGGAQTIGELCFPDRQPDPNQTVPGPDYDQFSPRVGSHCYGTNHQHIFGIEQVVFLGDSVTVGTPPTLSPNFYRTKLADMLADRFSLEKPDYLWEIYNQDGTSALMESGSFKSCAKWGARTDDLLKGGEQIPKCFPDGGSDERTLVIMTMGGNDISAITKAGGTDGEPLSEVEAMTQQAVDDLEEAMQWLADPQRFPNGSYVVFANPFEFTDGTGQTDACPAANLADLEAWDDPDELARLVIWLNEQWMRIAVDTGTDMIFMLENFCGHGFVATGPDADPNARCYLGPGTERWFDDTCIHPNPTGHAVIAQMFMGVVDEMGSPP